MARSIFPAQKHSDGIAFTAENTLRPNVQTYTKLSKTKHPHVAKMGVASTETSEYQGYLERVQNYIPAEIVAAFIFINSLIDEPFNKTTKTVTADGLVAIAALIICFLGCFLFAKVTATNEQNPAYKLQGVMFGIALLVWVYAMDAKAMEALQIPTLPSLSGLCLITFTIFSGLVVPAMSENSETSESGDTEPEMD